MDSMQGELKLLLVTSSTSLKWLQKVLYMRFGVGCRSSELKKCSEKNMYCYNKLYFEFIKTE